MQPSLFCYSGKTVLRPPHCSFQPDILPFPSQPNRSVLCLSYSSKVYWWHKACHSQPTRMCFNRDLQILLEPKGQLLTIKLQAPWQVWGAALRRVGMALPWWSGGWLRASNAGGPGSIPCQGTRSRMPQLKIPYVAMKIPHAATKILQVTTKTGYSQINK